MKNFLVIGNPISHSFSPLIHQANFNALGIDASYEKLLVDDIKIIRDYCKENSIDGFNVTLPFKESIVPMLDELHVPDWCRAVNTVKVEDGKFIGYNTDIYGILEDFKEKRIQHEGKRILILGYGGLGKTLKALFQQHSDVQVANRSMKEGIDILANAQQMIDMIVDYDLVVNTTKIGTLDDAQLSLDSCRNFNGILYDCTPKSTFIEKRINAETSGRAFNGLGMLVHQAAKAFEIWFGKKADVSAMKEALLGI